MSPSLPFLRAHVERGPASGVAPSRNAVAILHCTSSVGDLNMAVQHVPVPSPPALSIVACCSGGISLCSFAACCTASAAAKILECKLCKRHVPSQALRRDIVSRLHRSRADDLCSPLNWCPRVCLVQFAGLGPQSSLWRVRQPRHLPRPDLPLRPELSSPQDAAHGAVCSTRRRCSALCRSTADQYVACAAKAI